MKNFIIHIAAPWYHICNALFENRLYSLLVCQAQGLGLTYLKSKPAQAGPKPWASGPAGPEIQAGSTV
jgi:hypothetical protein